MVFGAGGVVVEGDVFSFLIELQFGGGGKALRERWLSGELVGELTRVEHGLRVDACGLGEAGIESQRRSVELGAILIGQLQKLPRGLDFIVRAGTVEWNVGWGCGSWLQRGSLCGLLCVEGGRVRRCSPKEGGMRADEERAEREGQHEHRSSEHSVDAYAQAQGRADCTHPTSFVQHR